jgi:hypothetical protein
MRVCACVCSDAIMHIAAQCGSGAFCCVIDASAQPDALQVWSLRVVFV